ncbi:MAG TPA: spore coat U domain-containing protein [Allosphingosinicella sp.]|nr:spore coat U domain-containing protein [Allosphingosinicella sp.]
MLKTLSTRALATGTAIAAATVCIPAPALAATVGGVLNTNATVTANCTVSTSPIAFGNVDSTSASDVDAAGGLTITCTNGSGWTASADVGSGSGASYANRRMTSGANLLNYNIYTTAARVTVWGDGTGSTATIGGTGTGSAQAVTVYGRVPGGQTSVPIGSYADTVAVTVTY